MYKSVPYGLAHILLEIPDDPYNSFEGLGFFTSGILHDGPFTYTRKDGHSGSYTLMKEGRPADNHFGTIFSGDDSELQRYSGKFNNALMHG